MSVSKVLHDRGTNVRVAPATAARIRGVAEQLGYHPNSIARSFRSRRTRTIGLLSDQFSMHGAQTGYFSSLLSGITTATFEQDYTLAICPRLVREQEGGMKDDGRFDGVIWSQLQLDERETHLVGTLQLPVVVLHSPKGVLPNAITFIADNEHGLELAVEHLASLGHKRIAFVVDPYNSRTAEGNSRVSGYQAAMVSRGLTPRVHRWDYHATEFAEYMKCPNRDTALITFSEFLARTITQSAGAIGVSIPDEISLVGFDSTAFCETSRPRLTAVSQPIEQMAYDATLTLLKLIEGEQPARRSFVYPCGLDIRESTGLPYLTAEVPIS